MSGFWLIVCIGIVLLLIGFILLQRRKPEDADKIATALDQAVKDAKQKASDVIGGKK
jgi:preprotein translocase subunit SecG